MAPTVRFEKREVPKLAARKRFSRYHEESVRPLRMQDVKEDKRLALLVQFWNTYINSWENVRLLRNLLNAKYTAKDIEKFSLLLADLQRPDDPRKAGGFFTLILQAAELDSDFTIYTKFSDLEIERFSCVVPARIRLIGNVGDALGYRMTDGEITVEGDVGLDVGESMAGGKIVVKGSFKGAVGERMEGGEVHLEGEYVGGEKVRVGRVDHGKIFHKGKLILEK